MTRGRGMRDRLPRAGGRAQGALLEGAPRRALGGRRRRGDGRGDPPRRRVRSPRVAGPLRPLRAARLPWVAVPESPRRRHASSRSFPAPSATSPPSAPLPALRSPPRLALPSPLPPPPLLRRGVSRSHGPSTAAPRAVLAFHSTPARPRTPAPSGRPPRASAPRLRRARRYPVPVPPAAVARRGGPTRPFRAPRPAPARAISLRTSRFSASSALRAAGASAALAPCVRRGDANAEATGTPRPLPRAPGARHSADAVAAAPRRQRSRVRVAGAVGCSQLERTQLIAMAPAAGAASEGGVALVAPPPPPLWHGTVAGICSTVVSRLVICAFVGREARAARGRRRPPRTPAHSNPARPVAPRPGRPLRGRRSARGWSRPSAARTPRAAARARRRPLTPPRFLPPSPRAVPTDTVKARLQVQSAEGALGSFGITRQARERRGGAESAQSVGRRAVAE